MSKFCVFALYISFVLSMASNDNVNKSYNKQCLNNITILVLKIKSNQNMLNVYSFQGNTHMHIFYKHVNGSQTPLAAKFYTETATSKWAL
jgi:hypothetical protein